MNCGKPLETIQVQLLQLEQIDKWKLRQNRKTVSAHRQARQVWQLGELFGWHALKIKIKHKSVLTTSIPPDLDVSTYR